MSIEQLITSNRQQILDLADKYGAYNVRIFGSVARGEAGPNSDVDLLVDLRPDVGLGFIGLALDLQDLLGKRVDLITADTLHPAIRDTVLREAVAL
jgi:predicted nucleotidyltransferase